MTSFSSLDLERSYRSSSHVIGRDFYERVLRSAVTFRRGAGYFSSSALGIAPDALREYFLRSGRIEIVCSETFSSEDLAALAAAVFDRPKQRRRWKLADLGSGFDGATAPDLLAWLISSDLLAVRIAVPERDNVEGIYHEKAGVFGDSEGNRVAFSGSANETASGYVHNFERVDVFTSFGPPADKLRVAQIEAQLAALWKNETPGLRVYTLAEAFAHRVLRARDERPSQQVSIASLPQLRQAEALLPHADLRPLPHQVAAISSWATGGGRGILEMATGSGKTVTALTLASRLYDRLGPPFAVVIVAPLIQLVDQWIAVARGFGLEPVRCAEGRSAWTEELNAAVDAVNSGIRSVLSIAVTGATMLGADFQSAVKRLRCPVLIIGDEAHSYGAVAMSNALPQNATYRVGLSATPQRWFDEAGTARLQRYFGDVVFTYGMADALRDGVLTPYLYYPILARLSDDEVDKYVDLSRQLARMNAGADQEEGLSDAAKKLLIRRARLVGTVASKLKLLEEALASRRGDTHILVYCGDGAVEAEDSGEVVRQVDAAVQLLGSTLGMKVASYTARTSPADRRRTLAAFAAGDIQALVAIRCLDEGVDLPATRSAYLLASSTNPRQFVQRRGRVLRRAPGKTRADIHDFVAYAPPNLFPEGSGEFAALRSLIRSQLARVEEFADLAVNGPVARSKLTQLRDELHLNDYVAAPREGNHE